MDELSPELICDYEDYLRHKRCVCPNTSSAYMRVLQAVYSRCVPELCPDRRPFRRVFTSVERTRKRSLHDEHLRALLALRLRPGSYLYMARDLFFFSFLAHGMAFVDMAQLTTNDIRDGRITYARSKTGSCLSVPFDGALAAISQRYHVCGSRFIFPLLSLGDTPRHYDTALRRYNRALHRLGEMAMLGFPLTSYCARHSWASIAYRRQVPLSVISQAMGHSSERTTRIYIAGLDNDTIDKACHVAAAPFEAAWMEQDCC